MDADLWILVLRLSFAALLYLFLLMVGIVAYRDLKRASAHPVKQKTADLARLVVVDSGETSLIPGQAFELLPVTSLGRDPANTVVIPDGFASGQHALLAWRDQQWWLEDLGSTNGTVLNRRPVQKPTRVNQGDIVQIGRVKLKMAK